MEISREKLLWAYERMVLIRTFEDKVHQLIAQHRLPGFAHLSAGQEAVAGTQPPAHPFPLSGRRGPGCPAAGRPPAHGTSIARYNLWLVHRIWVTGPEQENDVDEAAADGSTGG